MATDRPLCELHGANVPGFDGFLIAMLPVVQSFAALAVDRDPEALALLDRGLAETGLTLRLELTIGGTGAQALELWAIERGSATRLGRVTAAAGGEHFRLAPV